MNGAGTCAMQVRDGDSSDPVLVLSGELDYPSTPETFECVDRLLAAHPSTLTFDLSQLDFLGSGGVSLILHAVSVLAGSRQGTVIIRHPRADVLRLLRIAGVVDGERVRVIE